MNESPIRPSSSSPLIPPPSNQRPMWRRILGLPRARPGWWSIGLTAVFFLFLWIFQLFVASGQRGGDTFFSNPWLAATILIAAASALAGGVAAALAIFRRGERSILVLLALLLGLFVLIFMLGELTDH